MKIHIPMLRRQGGFSLLELMLVIAIIALISVAALPQVSEYNKRARGATSSQNMKTIMSAIQQYTLDQGAPPDPTTPTQPANGSSTLDQYVPLSPGASAAGGSQGTGSADFQDALARYVQLNSSLWESPNYASVAAGAGGAVSYGYKVEDTTVGGDKNITSFQGIIASTFNNDPNYEPSGATSGGSYGYAVNGYEDIGLLDPSGQTPLVYAGGADTGSTANSLNN